MPQNNRLAEETSPYLQQHAHNPVDWYPWNQEALNKAIRENKPILLSIGYAACHWCHVMAHESFEDEETANLMNGLFVNIKVDREERPDLDKVYQTAHYLLTQKQGGWPLTLFLTPNDLTPFFSGTYFPRESRYQLPAFKEVLQTIGDIYQQHRDEIAQQNDRLRQVLHAENPAHEQFVLNDQPLKLALQFLQQKFDKTYGGFGGAPKFPHPTIIEFLLEEKSPLATTSLQKMAEGGIYDQIQGGFFRYSVDEKWRIPHFEKMLYDNAQLLFLYATASQKLHDVNFEKIAHETAEWVLTKMQSPEGGYYSSLDADTDGHEGKFYIWNKFEIAELLSPKESEFAENYYGLGELPNFEKNWHLYVASSLESITRQLKISPTETEKLLHSVKQKLLTARDQRTQPGCDQKILTGWNALMIKAMAITGHILHEPRYLASAENALNFIRDHLWKNNHLLASYKDGKTHFTAYLDDYVFLIDALLSVYQITQKSQDIQFAKQLADNLVSHFYDKKDGGFFFTADDSEIVLYRPKTLMDEAIPSGNGIALQVLLKIDRLSGESRYRTFVEKTLQLAWPTLSRFPVEHGSLLLALKDFLA